ncbi:MAG: flavin-containing monooxygenase [Candidatus Promineifilaceae bacterium]
MKPKVLDVLVIGAGFAGVCVGIKLLEQSVTNFRIVEKSTGIGGTWYENTYPGAACDVASHLYCFSFEPNPNWSRVYSKQREIQAYIEHCVEKYGLRRYISHGKHVLRQQLDETKRVWVTQFADGEVLHSKHVVSGIGGLHVPKIPEFEGKQTFGGVSMHSARWNHAFDYRGKRVAMIGTAASAIQIIPELASDVEQLVVFQRTPNYVAPRYDRAYSDKEKARFKRWPFLNNLLRQFIFMRLEIVLYPFVKQNSRLGARGAKRVKEWMRSVIKDERLHEAMAPDYQMGCKRILISDHYYETFNRPNVSLITSSIERITETGIVSADGKHHHVDAIVYATGFDLDKHLTSIDVIGRNQTRLANTWADIPTAYRGVCTAGFPNYWFVTGPNTGVGTTSIVFMIEQATRYILECIKLADGGNLIEVKPNVEQAYNAEIQAALGETVWASGCKSWYMREDGRIAILYPYDARTWRKSMRRVNSADFQIQKI